MKGYYLTKNKDIPLNDREPGQLADIALQQLMVFNELADTWPVGLEFRDDRYCNVCRECDQNIWFSSDPNGVLYKYHESEIKALIVAHIRQAHDGK